VISHDFAGLLGRGYQLGAIGGAVVASIGPVIPLDLELLAALLRRPGIVGDDGDAAQCLKPDGIGVAGISTTRSTPATDNALSGRKT
jgi:hypothetical protein